MSVSPSYRFLRAIGAAVAIGLATCLFLPFAVAMDIAEVVFVATVFWPGPSLHIGKAMLGVATMFIAVAWAIGLIICPSLELCEMKCADHLIVAKLLTFAYGVFLAGLTSTCATLLLPSSK